MPIRILSHREVRKLLPMGECIDVMKRTLEATARGEAVNPLRTALRFPDGSGLLGLMPAYLGSPRCAGIKVVTVMPGNHGTEYDSHQGVVLLFEVENGRPLAMMDGSTITGIRTAAVSGLATRLLAREDATTLAILGSGIQARTHLAAMKAVRGLTAVRVWSRSKENARRFAERESRRHGIPVETAGSAREAVAGAEIICTTTSSREPVLSGEWISPGAHINAVGACLPNCRELDTAAVARARLFVDRRESAFNEAGDSLIPKREGAIEDAHILGEIGEILLGQVRGRVSADDITLFKSLGIGVEDLGAAYYIHQKAAARDAGITVELGGRRDEVD